MDLPLALLIAVVIGIGTGLPSVWDLLRRRRMALFNGVLIIWGLGGLLALAVTRTWPQGWEASMSSRMIVGMLFGLPASIGSLLLITILLELCDRVVGPGARLHLSLEALTVASGLFLPLWVLVLRPNKSDQLGMQGYRRRASRWWWRPRSPRSLSGWPWWSMCGRTLIGRWSCRAA